MNGLRSSALSKIEHQEQKRQLASTGQPRSLIVIITKTASRKKVKVQKGIQFMLFLFIVLFFST